ncbi:MAG: sodium-dependent transporter [Oscillospiraceae bacterium]|nr:sodium-dependent transporter [Oscillospiraceae bacterium]MCM0704844.1 sodium-dependent transporter [Faecalicatena sp. BF-R-105]MDY3219644.1 sodium-dependent transporter [Candidatus Fimivivens sp.]SFI92586.1 neurotransmitter:Na+ symporter, NSS family [Ruminococcaceae bacterium D5]GKH50486.1 sodium-dependent transporter [Eubacteriales bacterium]
MNGKQRETFSSRIGFLLISAGCAVGLGNVWRFPYIVGQYGGAAFVLLYLICLAILGVPILVMEFAVGRASRASTATAFSILRPDKPGWQAFGYVSMITNYLLMMFYTTIAGWMCHYLVKMLMGGFSGKDPQQVTAAFGEMVASPATLCGWMIFVVLLGMFICSRGLQNGVEKITKPMMTFLFVALIVLVIRSVTLPGAAEGLKFYLKPDFQALLSDRFGEALFAAMGQAFFTLSIGAGSMTIFGSYIGKDHTLVGEAVRVALLDTVVAFLAGLVIFPICSAFSVAPDSGPNLVFVTLPNIFNTMPLGRLWGSLFFVFMLFAALSTVVAVFENIISFAIDRWGWDRKKAVPVNLILIAVCSLPAALGFNLFSGIQPLGAGSTILDLEDFLVSNNLLPLGSLVFAIFCTCSFGWGWDRFIAEADAGSGPKFPKGLRFYFLWVVPILVLWIFVQGYLQMFGK